MSAAIPGSLDPPSSDKAHHPTAKLLVGGQGIPIAEFLQTPVAYWVTEW